MIPSLVLDCGASCERKAKFLWLAAREMTDLTLTAKSRAICT
jgi:hypothetical protein